MAFKNIHKPIKNKENNLFFFHYILYFISKTLSKAIYYYKKRASAETEALNKNVIYFIR